MLPDEALAILQTCGIPDDGSWAAV
jgi:hypothetical protein